MSGLPSQVTSTERARGISHWIGWRALSSAGGGDRAAGTAAARTEPGVGEVNLAVANLDQMTQQNAALVEQSAVAAASLRDQAAHLLEAVQVFKLRSV